MTFSFRRAKKNDAVIVDRVTGAFNRRQLDVDISAGIDTSDKSTATLMIDVNEFANYTGKKGSASGDQVLERVAWVIMATVRTTDVVYRHEASTFCVLLPATSDVDAVAVADRIGANVEKMPLLSACGVSITVGVASGPATDVADAVDRAVRALDEAVRTGKPRILNSTSAVMPSPVASPEALVARHDSAFESAAPQSIASAPHASASPNENASLDSGAVLLAPVVGAGATAETNARPVNPLAPPKRLELTDALAPSPLTPLTAPVAAPIDAIARLPMDPLQHP